MLYSILLPYPSRSLTRVCVTRNSIVIESTELLIGCPILRKTETRNMAVFLCSGNFVQKQGTGMVINDDETSTDSPPINGD